MANKREQAQGIERYGIVWKYTCATHIQTTGSLETSRSTQIQGFKPGYNQAVETLIDLSIIFGKDRANGSRAIDLGDEEDVGETQETTTMICDDQETISDVLLHESSTTLNNTITLIGNEMNMNLIKMANDNERRVQSEIDLMRRVQNKIDVLPGIMFEEANEAREGVCVKEQYVFRCLTFIASESTGSHQKHQYLRYMLKNVNKTLSEFIEFTNNNQNAYEGKAQMVEEDIQATHKTKEQIRQKEAGLEEAIRLLAQMDEEAKVQEAAQFYSEEDWDTIRAKLDNTEVVKRKSPGKSISNDDFAKRMVEMINEKKKFYAEQKAKAKRSKPMTQAQQREYMSTFIKNQSSWKLSQLKKLSFEELKTEFKKLMKSIESFDPWKTKAE
ncbi:hypothetical protein Tco_1209203 [Tanacetum coccineum]